LPEVVKRLVLASPRGYCAGVERAVEILDRALELHGAPVYVRKEIVHNAHVVGDFERRGAIFVESEEDVPCGEALVLSAHGVSPRVHAGARARNLETIDAACPLVSKVHAEARHFAARGFSIFLVGHAGHEEVEGTLGEAPDSIVLVQTIEDAERIDPPQTERLAYITQTTLSVDDTHAIVEVLRRRFPRLQGSEKEDICYATTNRQRAVKRLLGRIDLLLVIGSRNSSNSNRLVEVARAGGVNAHLIDDEREIEEAWLEGVETVGVTSGASAPESLVRRVVGWFRERGVTEVDEIEAPSEDVSFRLPPQVRPEPFTSS
jgi:4-hydroxy-3-methylbut-2-en-1-yl diphosphate reductase